MKQILKYLILLAITTSFLGCKKKEPEPTPSNTKGAVYFQFKQVFGTQDFALDTDFADGFGNKISFTRASFYLSKPVLKTSNGDILTLSKEYFLVHHDTKTAFITSVEATTISSVTTNFGLDATSNHSDPANYESTHPLAYQTPSMHWGWSSYYLFIVVEGRVDTNGDGNFDDTFAFHIGTDAFLKSISNQSVSIPVVAEKSAMIPFKIDYAILFEGIDLKTDKKTHTNDNMPLAEAFANNIEKAFSIE